MKNYLKRTTTFILAILMLLSVPLQAFAEIDHDKIADYKYSYINKIDPVKPAKLESGQTAEQLIANPAQPAIYTLRTDFKTQKGEKYEISYQPYIASVGAAATADEQKKVDKTIKLPALAGYEEPEDNFTIDYNAVKSAADPNSVNTTTTGNETNGLKHSARQEFDYKAKSNNIQIKHVFQKFDDFTKYTNPDGSTDEEHALITTQQGNTGSTTEVSPLGEKDPRRKGFVPEAPYINMQVPENAENFILEYRYNRAHYDINFDTAGGSPLPSRTLYYEQAIPKIADTDIPTKIGCDFLGWKPSVELKGTLNGADKTFNANEIIKDSTGNAIIDLHKKIYKKDANGNFVRDADGKPIQIDSSDTMDLIVPASKVTFTAVWKDKDKADYAIQFWAEKADHADDASLLNKYDYIGTRVYKDQSTGSRPDLDNVPVKDIVFPDLDQARLNKIWAGERFNRGKDLYLNKFYVYNQTLTHEQNVDPANVNLVKSVDATGRTVYNIYYDRQVYDLYFTESNYYKKRDNGKNTFYPEIWGLDENNNQVKLGGPGNPYHYKARFNQLMLGWPNDAMQTKGFSPGMQSYGWGPNYSEENWPTYLDTPPYRLNADEFLDMEKYTNWGGYVTTIDDGAGGTITAKDYRTLSFGINQNEKSMPHHMDFWMDGFKPGETIIRYDLYRFKADTNSDSYGHKFSKVQGFTPYGYTPGGPWPSIKEKNEKNGRVDGDGLDALNAEREAVTPLPTKKYTDMYGDVLPVGKMKFISTFFNNTDAWGDPLTDEDGNPIVPAFETNGYIKFEYTRNKYPLRFNYDPSKIKGDSEFNSTNQLDTFYEFPLKCLSPDLEGNEEYKKDNPANLLDNPEKLKELKLTDLVFTDPKDGKLKVKRPDNLSDQMVFKGWALDPAGTKLIWENPKETMPTHPLNLYAKWGEPDYKWKVTFDPDGGNLRSISEEKLTTERKTIQEGDIGQEVINTYAKKEANVGDKQVFTVIQRQRLVEPKKPTKKGYDFMGWEVIRYKKDPNTGDYTNEIDNSYRETYKVPELYSFGNDVVAPIYLKAIWVPNQRVDVDVVHHILSLDLKEETKKITETLHSKRAGYLVATTGDKQNEERTLVPHDELEEKLTGDLKTLYEDYNGRVKANNTFFQTFRVEPEKIDDGNGTLIPNPNAKNNVFHFFYRPYRTRDYKVNYIDERFKGKVNEKDGAIIGQEAVSNGNRHYDARNYRQIPGWVLTSPPQQQLFFDVNEETNAFLGINGTGKDEITFYYKDVRVIEVPKDGVTPEGYVRVTFKAEKGGSFGKDAEGNDITELNYDVIKGLKSDLLPVPKELAEGETVDPDKHYITPEPGKKFIKWDNSPLLNDNTIIYEAHTFTAYFEWSGLTASGLVRTEAFKDPNGTWINDFAPTINQLKEQLVWREKDQVKDLPAGTEIKLYDEAGNELTTDSQVYDLVNEKKAADKDQLVRTVNIKAKVTFKDGKEPQELVIPITVYKNVYEALNKDGDKPLFLKEAEGKEAKDGGLKDVTGDYVKVTVQPTEKNTNKDAKVYYVNPKAWVNIPEVEWSEADKDKYDFLKWTADKKGQNENKEENGIFDFSKRHKFTDKETLIKPLFTDDVVEQKEGEDKPKVPDNFVKVIVKTTDKATDETAFEKTFWVNPTKEVAITVAEPTGKENQKVTIDGLGEKDVNYIFKEWQKVQTGQADDSLTDVTPAVKIDLAKNQYTDKVTVIEAAYKKSIQAEPIVKPLKTTKLDTPQGKEITNDDLIKQITPQEGKEIESIEVISKPDPSNPGKTEAKVIVKYKDGTTQGTNDNPVVIPVEVHDNIIPAGPNGEKPEKALDNYVKVIFKAGTGGTVSGDLVYYVSPEVEVDMTSQAELVTKTPSIGYTSNGGTWSPEIKAEKITAEKTYEFNFVKSKDIVEKTSDGVKKPEGYVTVKFIAGDNGEVVGGNKTYYVNPEANIKLVDKDKATQGATNELIVPDAKANDNYGFIGWVEEIDYINPIKGDREHVAKFALGKVTLTYEAGEGTGTVPAKVTVDHGTSVRLAGQGTLTKENATFAGWKLDGEDKIYQPGDQVTLEKARTATAQWTNDKNIIPYNPDEPITRPKGYVRVTFAADPGLKLTEQKAYYVKANAKDAQGNAITLGNAELVKPAYEAQTGYKFKEWDKEDSLVIEAADILVTAKATKLDNVIPEKDSEGNPKTKPEGYKEVTFVIKTGDEAKGSIEGVAKFYVNPTEYVTINPPATKAETGYEFGAWDKDATIPAVYDKDTTITGSFNGLKDVIPNKNPDGTENKQPAGYKTVTFVIDPATGGNIADGEVTVYYVNPAKEVTVPQPKTAADTGYEFDKWDQDTTTAKKYAEDIKVKGNFKKLDDIIPSTDENGKPNAKPEGYVTVTFDKGDHGKEITGQTVYYVNPKADPAKTLDDPTIVKPTVKAETGYKFTSWNFADTKEILSDITVIAQYKELADVIPKTKDDESEKPDGYITVTFVKGANGELEGNTIFYVNPNKAVVLEDKAPNIKPNTGYTSAGWDTSINKAIQYKDGDKITALYNELGDVIPQENPDGSDKPAGYLTVTFDKGTNGELSGKTVYYVKPNKEVTVPAPTVTPNVGWKQKDGEQAWDNKLTRTFTDKNTTITAQYDPLENIIPGDQTKPNGYFTVTFKAENGSLVGTTTYYVKPNVEVNLKDKADALTKNPDLGYTAEGGTWDPTLGPKTYTEDETCTFKFKKLYDIIPGDQTTERPKGYVKVEFRSDINGSLDGNTIFYVNPNANKTMADITPLPTIKANKGYKVGNPNWHADFTNDTTEIKEDRIYVANYEALGEAKITYIPRDPEMGSVSRGSEDLAEDKEIQGSTATAKPGYEFVKWINTEGKKVSDDATFVPKVKQSATYIAVFKAKDPVTFTVKKVWEGDVSPLPTMNFTLYRQAEGGAEGAVPGAEVKEITKTTTEATWTNLPKEDSQGKPYTYSVKESFKDTDIKNDNWILGEMVTDANGNTITNKLKSVPGTVDTPNENEHRMGKLTITKKIESKVVEPQMSRAMHRAPAAPLEFTFKVTDPYGTEETFTLKAGESKELNNLLYGDYTVEETDSKGLTPYFTVGNGSETKGNEAKVTLTKDVKEGTVAFTNKNVKPEENPNIIEVKASKVWVNGPSADHTAVDLKLYRQADGGQKEEVTDVTPDKSRYANDVNKFNYVWKDLPKINDEGKEYTYTVEEPGVTNNEVKFGDNTYTVTQEGNTITNTYVVPKTDDLIATKQWVDVPDGTTTPEVKFQLQRTANGVTEDVGQAMALTNNQVNFGKQDKTDANGNVYVYSVKELGEDGNAFNHTNYTSVVDGLSVTNTYHAPEVKYTVTYLPGSSTAIGTMPTETDVKGTYTVKANGFTNDGYTFKGWKLDNGTIVQPGDTITITANVTMTAIWEKTTTPPTPDPDKPNPDNPRPWDPDNQNPWNPDYPNPWNPNYPNKPYIPMYPEVRYETIVQEKIVKVPLPIADNAYVKEVRYMQGYMGDFRPKDGLTRAEAAQILANALVEDGYKYNPNFKLSYKDIGEAWYTRAIKIVTEAKVFAGYDDGNFKPEDKITRNEWIATLKRFQELGDVSGNHMKLKDGHWAMGEIEAAYKEGWLKIYTDGLATYEGDKFIPREEVAAVSNKAFKRILDKTYIRNNEKNLISYKDVKKDMWSYEDILCASNTFLYKKDLYRAHWIKEDNNEFNINTDGFEIVKAKFQRNPR